MQENIPKRSSQCQCKLITMKSRLTIKDNKITFLKSSLSGDLTSFLFKWLQK